MKIKVQGGYATDKSIADLSKGSGASDANTLRTILSSDTVITVAQQGIYDEDTAHVSGDKGQMVFGVRNDAGVAFAADGDYMPMTFDATGQLRVAAAFSEGATAADGGALPALTKVVSGYDGANVQALKTDANGELQVDILSQPALSHASSSVKVGDGTDFLSITGTGEAEVSDATTHTTLSSISGKLPASLGAQTGAGSLSVVLASDGSLPLPTGAATAAKQDTGNTSLGNIDTSTSGLNAKFGSLGQKNMAGSAPVVLASDQSAIPASQSGTWNIADITGTVSLPTGAATSAKQDTGNTSLGNIDTKLPASIGQKAMAASLPVVLASDQSSIPVTASALTIVDFFDTPLLDASSTNIPASGSSTLQVVASTAATVKKILVIAALGEFIGIYVGAGNGTLTAITGAGFSDYIEVSIASGSRISIRNMENSAITTGLLAIQFLG